MKKIIAILIMSATITLSIFSSVCAQVAAQPDRPEIFIRAINPGYTVDGVSNVGEFIELAREFSDQPISLASFTIGYTNSSGNFATLYEFPENSWMTGESILLRLASSPDHELADLVYSKTLAMAAGPLEIKKAETVIDALCWTGKDDCYEPFKSATPTTLVRNSETFLFEHQTEYVPKWDASTPGYHLAETKHPDTPDDVVPPQCQGLLFSEILSYYESSKSEQFIEFYNPTSEQILLTGCSLRYKNKSHPLSGIIQADSYFVYYPTDFTLTKNPTTSNLLEILDLDGSVVEKLEYPNGQRKATSYARIGYDASGYALWRITYDPTPGQPNNYQQYKTCEAGKVINEDTGNCVNVSTTAEKVCNENQYLNPLTGRCKAYETTTAKTCPEGYYLNPDTNRCRKIKNNDGADFSVENASEYSEQSTFIATIAIGIIIALGLAYVIFQFRHEIKAFFDKVFRQFH